MQKLTSLLIIALLSQGVFSMEYKGYQPGLNLHYHLEMGASKAELETIGASQNPPRHLPGPVYDFQATGCIFDGFPPFSDAYFGLCSVLGKSKDFYTLTHNALQNAHKRGIHLFECIVSPELATHYHIDWKEMLHEVDAAITMTKNERPIKAGALLTFIRGENPTQGQKASEYMEYLVRQRTNGKLRNFVGVHLSGPEGDNEDYSQFIPVYNAARAAGLGLAAHAGEWGNASNIRKVIDQLQVTRIGHGIRAIEDKTVIAYVAAKGVLLEGCPSSNICTGALESRRYVDLPFRKLFDAGVKLYACNTDDPTLFGDATEFGEAQKLKQNLGFTDDEFRQMEAMGIAASFLPAEDKQYALEKLTT